MCVRQKRLKNVFLFSRAGVYVCLDEETSPAELRGTVQAGQELREEGPQTGAVPHPYWGRSD